MNLTTFFFLSATILFIASSSQFNKISYQRALLTSYDQLHNQTKQICQMFTQDVGSFEEANFSEYSFGAYHLTVLNSPDERERIKMFLTIQYEEEDIKHGSKYQQKQILVDPTITIEIERMTQEETMEKSKVETELNYKFEYDHSSEIYIQSQELFIKLTLLKDEKLSIFEQNNKVAWSCSFKVAYQQMKPQTKVIDRLFSAQSNYLLVGYQILANQFKLRITDGTELNYTKYLELAFQFGQLENKTKQQNFRLINTTSDLFLNYKQNNLRKIEHNSIGQLQYQMIWIMDKKIIFESSQLRIQINLEKTGEDQFYFVFACLLFIYGLMLVISFGTFVYMEVRILPNSIIWIYTTLILKYQCSLFFQNITQANYWHILLFNLFVFTILFTIIPAHKLFESTTDQRQLQIIFISILLFLDHSPTIIFIISIFQIYCLYLDRWAFSSGLYREEKRKNLVIISLILLAVIYVIHWLGILHPGDYPYRFKQNYSWRMEISLASILMILVNVLLLIAHAYNLHKAVMVKIIQLWRWVNTHKKQKCNSHQLSDRNILQMRGPNIL